MLQCVAVILRMCVAVCCSKLDMTDFNETCLIQADNLENLTAGTYVLFWDNSYSMMTGKALK